MSTAFKAFFAVGADQCRHRAVFLRGDHKEADAMLSAPPGVECQPLKKIAVDPRALLKLVNRWREAAEKVGCRIECMAVAFEAGRVMHYNANE
jgi:hypothetical protein